MEQHLSQLEGMASVKMALRDMLITLRMNLRRQEEGFENVEFHRHMIFTGNPGTGKTRIARLVSEIYNIVGYSSRPDVVEVQRSDLVGQHVGSTGPKTAAAIGRARGGVLFVDEAYQLTDTLGRGGQDFGGEAVDEMMREMLTQGPNAVTFIFAGYRESMDRFLQYNPGLPSRITFRFHFDDYSIPELVRILALAVDAKGRKIDEATLAQIPSLIERYTDAKLRSNYNGRLCDVVLQSADEAMNRRLASTAARGEALVTYTIDDFEAAFGRFSSDAPAQRCPLRVKVDRHGLGQYYSAMKQAGLVSVDQLAHFDSDSDYAAVFTALGIVDQSHQALFTAMVTQEASAYQEQVLPPGASVDEGAKAKAEVDISFFVTSLGFAQYAHLFVEHEIDVETLGDLTYEHLNDMGIKTVGGRLKILKAIREWNENQSALAQHAALQLQMRLPSVPAKAPASASLSMAARAAADPVEV